MREDIGEVLAQKVPQIFNQSMQTGHVGLPQEWRDAQIVLLFKRETVSHRSDPCNYRPVGLNCVVCKVMERILKDNITEHLNEYNVIKESQHGFARGRSF